MAGAWAQRLAGDRLDVATGGSQPAERIDPDMAQGHGGAGHRHGVPHAPGIDAALANGGPDAVITLGGAPCPIIPGALRQDWDVPDPAGKPIEVMRQVRDEIEARVKQLIAALVP